MVKGIFVTRDALFSFPVKCEMALISFLVNRDFHSHREACFSKMFSFREMPMLYFS